MIAIIFAAVIAAYPLTTVRSADTAWHYNSGSAAAPIEVMRVSPNGIVELRYCDGKLRRIGHIIGHFIPREATRISGVAFDKGVGSDERALVTRIVDEVHNMKSTAPWDLACVS